MKKAKKAIKIQANGLITIEKNWLLKDLKLFEEIPRVINRNKFTEYYYYAYNVELLDFHIIHIEMTDTAGIEGKRVSTPERILKSITHINLHIPKKIRDKIGNHAFWTIEKKDNHLLLEDISEEKYRELKITPY